MNEEICKKCRHCLSCICGDIVEAPSLAELGGYEKLSAYLLQHWGEVDKSCVDTICKSVVGILMNYGKDK